LGEEKMVLGFGFGIDTNIGFVLKSVANIAGLAADYLGTAMGASNCAGFGC